MICNNCRRGADELAYYKKTVSEESGALLKIQVRTLEDYIGRAKTLHAQCESIDCFCQHRVNK